MAALDDDDDDDDKDRNYLVYDMKRGLYFRIGMAEVGMKRRWKENFRASMRSSNVHRNNVVYIISKYQL